MLSRDARRHLTERQQEVLSIVVENQIFKNKETVIPEIAERLGIAPVAVYKHLLEIERTDLISITVTPSDKGKNVYERVALQPPRRRYDLSEALTEGRRRILEYVRDNRNATLVELTEELGMSEYAVTKSLRILEAISCVIRSRGRAVKRGVPPYVYNATPHGVGVLRRTR